MYTIKILKHADWFSPGTVVYDHGYGRPGPVKICLVSFLIEGNGRKIIVDGGMDGIDKTYTDEDKTIWDHLGPSKDIHDLLKEQGLSLDDIDTVLLSHLHFDHYLNVQKFKNADFYVSKKEWFHVMDTDNLPRTPVVGFPREPLAYLAGEAYERLYLLNDIDASLGESFEIYSGISMHWVGGHSPGGMVVKVDTNQGSAIVVGDAFYLYEHIDKNIPMGYCTDYKEVLNGYRWLRDQNAILLPSHDYKIFEKHPSLKIG
ncbi:N-acyl homoserine lactonase family protein [Virgibacillus natechei]